MSKLGSLILEKTKYLKYTSRDFIVFWVEENYGRDLFKLLVSIVLSQNTSDKNSIKAYDNLEKKIGVTPEKIASTKLEDIEEAIKPAGLYRQKAYVIKQLAEAVLENRLDLKKLKEMSLEEARRYLTSFKGVGLKTADLLLQLMGKPTIAVDTHAMRVAVRLGLSSKQGYEPVRQALLEVFDPKDYKEAHVRLILVGRKYCKPRKPKCSECPLKDICAYCKKT